MPDPQSNPGDTSLRNYGVAAPHGPNMTSDHVATDNIQNIHNMSNNEKAIFDHLLKPEDSYDASGTYWADMSFFRRARFTSKIDNAEAKKELKSIGRMIQKDPLSPVGFYFRNMVLPGAGLLLEGYTLFSIGNLKILFQQTFPTCWKKPMSGTTNGIDCDQNWIAAVDYLEIVGIMLGQVAVGFIGDWLGRRWGLIQDAAIMTLGLLMLSVMWGNSLNGWVICYAWSLFIYSFGVGGEYPMTATSGMENAVGSGKVSTAEDRLHRGRKVVSAFLMQGWGQVLNIVILILGLLVFHGNGNPPYTKTSTQYTFRVSFAIPFFLTLWLVYYRAYKMRYASRQLDMAKKKASVTGYDKKSLQLTVTYFGSRLIATCGTWFCNDVFFYGNKLFQSTFIQAISPAAKNNVMTNWLWSFCNTGVSLAGYYLASFLVDNKLYGRKWMQQVGFLLDFILFVVPAFNYDYYKSPAGAHSFQAMYFLSSFFNQFGPNCVTFLIAAESYPTPIRATAHGFSAMCGKAGALLAAVLYNYIDDQTKFYFIPWWGLIGMLLTFFFLPDTTGLDMKEQERRWNFIREGREHDYHGIAIHPHHLSLWERFRGVGKYYDPAADYEQKMAELRGDWERWQEKRTAEPENGAEVEDESFHDDVSSYFKRTGGDSVRNEKIRDDSS